MRSLVACGLVWSFTSAAFADMEAPRPRPSILTNCRKPASWSDITQCIKRFGTAKEIRSSSKMHLLQIQDHDSVDLGIYLYVESPTGWTLGGAHRGDQALVAFDSITIGKHSGYRMEFAGVTPTAVQLADSSTVPAMLSTRTALYCGGDSYACTEVTTACDILVRGKAYRTFRGAVELENTDGTPNTITISGDRKQAGECAPPAHMFFNWPQN